MEKLHITLTGNSCMTTHEKNSVPRSEEKSNLSSVPGLGISLTKSNCIFVPGPFKNWRYALDACELIDHKFQCKHSMSIDAENWIGTQQMPE